MIIHYITSGDIVCHEQDRC